MNNTQVLLLNPMTHAEPSAFPTLSMINFLIHFCMGNRSLEIMTIVHNGYAHFSINLFTQRRLSWTGTSVSCLQTDQALTSPQMGVTSLEI